MIRYHLNIQFFTILHIQQCKVVGKIVSLGGSESLFLVKSYQLEHAKLDEGSNTRDLIIY
jgi:hypothetical protein